MKIRRRRTGVVALARGEDVLERIAVVDRHDLRAQRVLGGVQREREPDRHVGLRQPVDAGRPADGRDRRAAVGDADVRQPPRRREHVVEVHHRLAHPHEHEVVDRLDAAGSAAPGRGSPSAVRLRPNFIEPVAQNVHVSGQPDCEETQIGAAPVAVAHQHGLDRPAVAGVEQRLDGAVGGVRLVDQPTARRTAPRRRAGRAAPRAGRSSPRSRSRRSPSSARPGGRGRRARRRRRASCRAARDPWRGAGLSVARTHAPGQVPRPRRRGLAPRLRADRRSTDG